MTRRVYVCGLVTGLPGLNRPAFESAAAELRDRGLEPVVPHDYVPADAEWDEAMRICIPLLLSCDEVVTIPDWAYSKGASLEESIAIRLGMRVRHFR